MIARIHKQYIPICLFKLLFQCADCTISHGTIYIRVYVIGIKNHNIIGFWRFRRRCAATQ